MRAQTQLIAALVAATMMGGCVSSDRVGDGAATDPERGEAPLELLLGDPVSIDDRRSAKEAAIVEHPEGRIFSAGFSNLGNRIADPTEPEGPQDMAPFLWASDDGGTTWERLDVGSPLDGAFGDSDVDLAVAPDGTLYFASLSFTPLFTNNVIVVGASTDAGATWSWAPPIAAGPFVDRPWVEVAPDSTAHLVWNDGLGIHHVTSSDRGGSWQRLPDVHPDGGDGGFSIGPAGELAVRVVPVEANGATLAPVEGNDGVAVSTDGGATWTFHAIPGDRGWANRFTGDPAGDATLRAWDPVAFDEGGTLYAAWGETDALRLSSSHDLGATWTTTTLFKHGSGTAFYPFLRGGPAGELVATWFHQADGLEVHMAFVANASGGLPQVSASMVWERPGDTYGEYLQVAFLREGGFGAVVGVQGFLQFFKVTLHSIGNPVPTL